MLSTIWCNQFIKSSATTSLKQIIDLTCDILGGNNVEVEKFILFIIFVLEFPYNDT